MAMVAPAPVLQRVSPACSTVSGCLQLCSARGPWCGSTLPVSPGSEGGATCRFHASIPQAARMDYLRKPEGKQMDLVTQGRGPKPKQGGLSKHLAKLGRSGRTAKPGKVSVQGVGLAV